MESSEESRGLVDQPFAGFKHRFARMKNRLARNPYDAESLGISTLCPQKKPLSGNKPNSVVDTIPVGTYQTPFASLRTLMRM
ncbi:MAG: hypothetical protein CGW95_14125 [Phenylobacterium zucineum]|nr:MAG: hypothetical protein CGW95_14125 [Phenylobacterium zucineum]